MLLLPKLVWLPLLLRSCLHSSAQAHICSEITEYKDHDNADFVIGGMFPVHYLSNNAYIYNPPGLTWIEAMLFALEEINNSSKLLAGIKLGFTIHDTCNEISIALQSSLNMTKQVSTLPAIAPDYDGTNASCSCAKLNTSIIGLVGDASSKTTIKVAGTTAATNTPQISYSATSTDLSAKQHYPTFLRTIPPDNFQAKFIVDILLHFQWKYVNILASDDDYGRIGINELIPELKSNNICIAMQEIYDIGQDSARTRSVVARLKMENQATVIVLWGQIPEAKAIFTEAQRQELFYRTWIATEAYGSSPTLTAYDSRVVQGLLGIIPAKATYRPFVEYLVRTQPNSSSDNPWLQEYWESQSQCKRIAGARPARYVCPKEGVNLSALPPNKYLNVIDAVYALAHALQNMISAIGLAETKKEMTEGDLYLDFVKNVSFKGKLSNISFDSQGNPDIALYSLTNLQVLDGKLSFATVALWDSHSRQIVHSSDQIEFSNESTVTPKSTCAEECPPGSYGLRLQDKPCCWQCVRCRDGMVQSLPGQDFCYQCPDGTLPNMNKTECTEPNIEFYKLRSPSGIMLVIVTLSTSLGILASIGIFHVYRNTPVVKALNRGLSYLQLASMLVALCMPCIFFLHQPTKILCGLSLFYFICFHSIIITVVFMKADRLLRIFKASQAGVLTKRSVLKSNKVQFITVALLTFIGLVICTILYSVFQPNVRADVDFRERLTVMYYCGGNYDTILLTLLGYVFIISVVCAVYAFLARKLPEDYNEAKYTSFAMFTSCLGWIMFVPLYFSRARDQRSEVLCYVSYISITVIFLLMYVPKIRVIIFYPELNTQQVFRDKMKERHISQGQAKLSVANEAGLHSTRKKGVALHVASNSSSSNSKDMHATKDAQSNRNRSSTML